MFKPLQKTGDQTCVWSHIVTAEQDSFKIRLTSAGGFWMVDSFKLSSWQQYTFKLIVWFLVGGQKYKTPLKAQHTESITFHWKMSAFDTILGESSCRDQDCLLSQSTSHHQLPGLKKGSFFSCLMSILQMFILTVKWTSLGSWETQVLGLLTYPK